MSAHTPSLSESDRPTATQGGHWLLASIGKKVLRPGGRETTEWLLNSLTISGKNVVELAPGLGTTAKEILKHGPASYTAIEQDEHACQQVTALFDGSEQLAKIPHTIIHSDAAHTKLPDASADIVIGEAMLTMQGGRAKDDILAEVARVLKPGGYYAIHELALTPDDLDKEISDDIRKRLARTIKVNARPLTLAEWESTCTTAGFKRMSSYSTDMALLEPNRMLADEGLIGTLRILFNLMRKPEIRKRVVEMRSTFTKYKDHLAGIGMVLTKE